MTGTETNENLDGCDNSQVPYYPIMPDTAEQPNLSEISGFPGYFAKRDGKTYGLKGQIILGSKIGQHTYLTLKKGYGSVRVNKAALLLRTFKGGKGPAYVPEHIDGNTANFHIDNLQWRLKRRKRPPTIKQLVERAVEKALEARGYGGRNVANKRETD